MYILSVSDFDTSNSRTTFGMWAQAVSGRLQTPARTLNAVGLFIGGKVMKHFDNPALQILGPGSGGEPLHNRSGAAGMMGSVQHRVVGQDGVEVGSNKIYTRIHALGGVIKAKGDGWLSIPQRTSRRGKPKSWRKVKSVTIPQRNVWILNQSEELETITGLENYFFTRVFNTHD